MIDGDGCSYTTTILISGKSYKVVCKNGIIDTKEKELTEYFSNRNDYIPIDSKEEKEEKGKKKNK